MTVAVIQARMGSTRLPGKVLRPLGGRPTLGWVIRAAQQARQVDAIVVATTTAPADDELVEFASDASAEVFRGSEDDVLDRFVRATEGRRGPVVRLTADCPLLDPAVIDMAVAVFTAGDEDYVSTIFPRSLPRGLDVEVVSREGLLRANREATGPDRVHVTSWLYRHEGRARIAGVTFQPAADDLRVTMDTQEDAEALEALVAELGDRAPRWRDVVSLLRSRPDIVALNREVRQKALDEG